MGNPFNGRVMRQMLAFLCVLAVATPAVALSGPPDLAAVLASQVGRWEGSLDYRDYQADKWFGLPVKVEIRDGGDGVTQIRVADFDDGPRVGNVRITTVTLIGPDGATEYTGTFRKGREAELGKARLSLVAAVDASHWTIIAESDATDNNRPARIRITTTRDGDSLTSLKEVDFSDDAETAWLQRNRQILRRVGE